MYIWPARMALTTAWVRLTALSFRPAREISQFTVRSLMPRMTETSHDDLPAAIHCRTSRSRNVSSRRGPAPSVQSSSETARVRVEAQHVDRAARAGFELGPLARHGHAGGRTGRADHRHEIVFCQSRVFFRCDARDRRRGMLGSRDPFRPLEWIDRAAAPGGGRIVG